MFIIDAINVNDALTKGLRIMARQRNVTAQQSRDGPVRVATRPVTTLTHLPMQRVLFSPTRNANPFFHLFESLWMLSGRNDLPWLAQFNKQMAAYSDDGGKTQPAAYGHRWISHFGVDQITAAVQELTERPNSRRAVIDMWDSANDMLKALAGSKDVPCNTTIFLKIRGGKLEMTVCCRSNDLWWGCHGANAVHFSVLQEYIAAHLNVPMGCMYQISNDYHLYTDRVKFDLDDMASEVSANDHYRSGRAITTPIVANSNVGMFDEDLAKFMHYARPDNPDTGAAPLMDNVFLAAVALPMLHAWRYHKQREYAKALEVIANAPVDPKCDWTMAAYLWLSRVAAKYCVES